MPAITDPPPAVVAAELDALKTALDASIPAKTDDNTLVATWNIRSFGDLTRKWESKSGDSPTRDLHSALAIARILERFDVIAIQEVKSNLRALRDVLKVLGPGWSFALTDVTYGDAGNGERLCYLFNTDRAQLSGLACELVVPEDLDTPYSTAANAFQRQFVRTPYAVSFRAGRDTFVLVTLHVIYGDRGSDRRKELEGIAKWLREWAERTEDYSQNLICLGDFNIDREGDDQYMAFTSTGLKPAPDHTNLPRTVFDDSHETGALSNFYDQVAWFETLKGKPYLTMQYKTGGNFDFRGILKQGMSTRSMSYRISDHFPLWVEFERLR
ncbi:endonuclease/exonuclease/phosphatase family protein [Parerythrobacter aestuarii]|uniref:endonuclease/exonuclease/phosphatase family protein n=1 Tax=Parerythrobacter aestuarii TaxID=3020909 RepID=UPI0024DEC335|nr:endonuclease/exonuclease/phosphatase family protein [Parerythrobacter aestuarii]